jgi:ABC-type proline/glycine betaine transport system ATPase subunit
MDEPFGALDPGTREALQDEFLRLNARLKKTVVIVTHDIAEAGRLAGDIVLLDRGRLVQRGTLRDLLVRPADARVRAFLGRRGANLALDVLQLRHVIEDVPDSQPGASVVALPADLPLGQVLAALAGAANDATITVDGMPRRVILANSLRTQILADLNAAAS